MLARLPAKASAERELIQEIERLRQELGEANSILNAIRNGEIDALLLSGEQGEAAYVLNGADHVYRAIVEEMREGYVTLAENGTILFCNKGFSRLLQHQAEKIIGTSILNLVGDSDGKQLPVIWRKRGET